MNICIIGMNLTSLVLSRAFLNNGCIVNIFNFTKKTNSFSTRTVGISKSNLQFINDNIIDLKSGGFHNVSKIRIFNEEKKEITKFYNPLYFFFRALNNFFIFCVTNKIRVFIFPKNHKIFI